MNFRVFFRNFIKDPIAYALLLTLFSHAKVIFQAYLLFNIISPWNLCCCNTYFFPDSTSTL